MKKSPSLEGTGSRNLVQGVSSRERALDRYRKKKAKPRIQRKIFWVAILLVIGLLFAAWWAWSSIYSVSPEFYFILISKNGDSVKLLNGETLPLHPEDRVKILKISTNVGLNWGVRLVSTEFDVNALVEEALPISELLPEREIFDRYTFRATVKRVNQEMGHFVMVIEPRVEDWLDRADGMTDVGERMVLLERALDLRPNDERIRDRLVDEYKSSKEWQKAASLLEMMAEQQPDQDVLPGLLELYEAMSKKDQVIAVLRRILEKNPEDLGARLRLAVALEKGGSLKSAIKEYEKYVERIGTRERLPVYKTLGYLYTKTNQTKEAISSYLKAAELDNKDVNLFYNLSDLYEKTDQIDKSDEYLGKAVALKSGDTEGHLELAERLIKRGKYGDAEEHISAVLKKNPKSMEALLLRINIQEKKGDKKGQKETYDQILSFDKANQTVIYNLAVLEYETGNYSKSLSQFKAYLKSNPTDAVAHAFVFDIYRKQKNDKLAFEQAQTLIRLKPQEISYYHYLFEYLDGLGNYEKMIELMGQGLKSSPNNPDLREYLVVAYLKTGKEGLAIAEMEKILKSKPKDLSLLLRLAKLKERQGDFEGALEAYKKILDISPDHEEAGEAYLRLRIRASAQNGG
ncbi:MAG: tetratricopeptide repeat protein [Deltaproteobacteria bacterium]|nr:tetratricopeptide repeat protein [Deltaproteobacteria bacterium]